MRKQGMDHRTRSTLLPQSTRNLTNTVRTGRSRVPAVGNAPKDR